MKIFSRAEFEHTVELDTIALGVIRNVFVALAEDSVMTPSILSLDVVEYIGEGLAKIVSSQSSNLSTYSLLSEEITLLNNESNS